MHTIYIYTLEITNDTNCFKMIGVEAEHFSDFSALIWQTYSSMTYSSILTLYGFST